MEIQDWYPSAGKCSVLGPVLHTILATVVLCTSPLNKNNVGREMEMKVSRETKSWSSHQWLMVSLTTNTSPMSPLVLNQPESSAQWTIMWHPFLRSNNAIHRVPCLYILTGFLQPVWFSSLPFQDPSSEIPTTPPLKKPIPRSWMSDYFSPACWLVSGFIH